MISRRRLLGASAAATAALSLPGGLLALEKPRARSEAGGPIDLSSNENAWGAFPSVEPAMARALPQVHRYPDSHYRELWDELARHHRARPEEIAVGNGSNDLLRMAADALCGRTRTLVQASPTFEALAMYVRRSPEAKVVSVPLRADHAHDLDAMLAKAREGADVVYLCNPNNPTATITPRPAIERFLAELPRETFVLIDEAYHHFAIGAPGYESFADRRVDDPRVLVLRTFSKVYGLAGLRLGYAVGAPELVERVARYQAFDNPNLLAVVAGIAALRDTAGRDAAIRQIAADRAEFLRQAASRKVATLPSHANFVMVETGRPVRQAIDHFREHGIRIGRPFPPYDTLARISFGLPAEMRTFWKIWDALPPTAG
jgi:histidinol-phosphate aminotransferase